MADAPHPLDPIFHPRSVALVGVPSKPGNIASGFLASMLEQHYQDVHPLYVVHPRMRAVAGLRCYPTLLDIPGRVDHVISLVPARAAAGLVDQCIAKGVRSIHFYTAGLAETGDPVLVALQDELIGRLRAAGIRAVGPNSMGLYVPASRLAFMPGFPREPGNVMLISQSGANAADVIHGLGRRGVRFSKVVSFGNGADVRAWELFEYAAWDPETAIVTAYIEGVQSGRRFFDAVRRCAAVKPTVILKGGLTDAGARAARSHTGSLAGSLTIFDAMCRQVGAMRAETMDDLHDLVVAVGSSARDVPGSGVGLVGGGGGIAVLSADALARAGLDLPPTDEATKRRLREFIPIAGTSVNNPIDTNTGPELMERILRIVAAAPGIDVIFTTPPLGRGAAGSDARPPAAAERRAVAAARRAARDLARLQADVGVPFVALQRERGSAAAPAVADAFQQAAYRGGIATFPSIHRAARTVGHVLRWRAAREGRSDAG